MTCNFTSFSTAFQSYRDDEGLMRNGTPFTVEKNTPRAGLELGTVRSAGQRLTFFVFLGRHGSVFQTTHKCPCNSSLDTLFFYIYFE